MMAAENAHISEKISFLTNILTAWDGSEQRQALRREPRRYVSYDYTGMDAEQSERLRALIYHAQSTAISFPLWHAAAELPDNASSGQHDIVIPREYLWCYRNIGSVALWLDDVRGGSVYDLKYITATGLLGLTGELGKEWKAIDTMVMPVFQGVLAMDDSFTSRTDIVSEMTLNFELLQNQNAPPFFPKQYDVEYDEEIPTTWGYQRGLPALYKGVEVWRYEPQWADNLDGKFTKNANRIDYDTGVFKFDPKSYNPSETREITYALKSRAMINNLARFFYRHKGAWKSFWAPTWICDMELLESVAAGSMQMNVKMLWYWKYYNKSGRRKKIVVFFKDGTCQILSISGYSRDQFNTYGVVFLEEPLKKEIVRERVLMISFFCRYRFASDDLLIDYETSRVATASITLKEVDN